MDEIYSLPESGIIIVPAGLRDVKNLQELEKMCFQLDAWPFLDLVGVLTFPHIIRLKALEGQKLAGFIALDLRRTHKIAWIATLAVHPDYRRQGIGSRLLEVAESKVALPRIRLSVRRSNQPAIDLYRKYGYRQVDVWRKYYRGGDDALVFEKLLG